MIRLARRIHRDERGGSLIEALVASALLGVALLVLVGSFSTFAIAGADARQVAFAQATARSQAARIRAAPYNAAGNYAAYLEPVPAGQTLTLAVSWWDGTSGWVGTQNANGLQRVAIVVTHGTSGVATLDLVKADR